MWKNTCITVAWLQWYVDQCKNAFKQYPDLLAKYQEAYLYFLVDEFQDTNAIQNSIILSLCVYWDEPNLFVVGDDDQAIFRFQGADQQNLLTVIEKYPSSNWYALLKIIARLNTYSMLPTIYYWKYAIRKNIILPIADFTWTFRKINKKLIAATPHPYDHPSVLKSYVNATEGPWPHSIHQNRWIESPASISDIAVIVRRNKSINELNTSWNWKGSQLI